MAAPRKVNPQVEVEEGEEKPVTTMESIGIVQPEVVVGEAEQVQGPPKVPTFKIRVNRDIENMSYIGGYGPEHYSFEQGHEYDGVPYHIVEELERIGAVWH